jgi:hypothetical protein
MSKLSKEELRKIINLKDQYSTLKTRLADIELEKINVINGITSIKSSFKNIEQSIVKKHGEGATIDLQTGEIKSNDKPDKV